MSDREVRVTLADDHPPTRLGIRRTLEDVGLTVVAEAGDGDTALAHAIEHEPDLCLLDLHMPGGGGVEATRRIVAASPASAVVILTVSRDDTDLFAALRAGASGYLLKDMDPARLGEAVLGVLRGEAAIPRDLVSRLVEDYRGKGDRRVPTDDGRTVALSAREHEILTLLAEGLATGAVAERLSLAPVTVRSHVAAAMRKLRVSDREAALRLVRRGDPHGRT